jgi:FtsP/CotA-like multicopper oxidase with cupredoxin domain
MSNNGTSIHFHGVRQNYTNQMDGVPSITQCPIAPGDSFTYTWRATQYGSSWYHSHFYVQAWDGVLGGIIINGPASGNYDEDLGNLFLNDWSHSTADVLAVKAATAGSPTLDNCLINGTNVYDTSGSRFATTFAAGTSYRIRLANAAADTHFKFMIDNHTMEVIATDFVPIVPYNATTLSIGIGQRYDIIVTALESSGDFWMRAIPQESCSDSNNVDNILGIVRYDSSSTSDPTTSAYDYTDSCDDEDISNLKPYLTLAASDSYSLEGDFAVMVGRSNNVVKWYLGGTSFMSQWDYPTVLQVAEGNDTWSTDQHVIKLDTANEWVYFIIETTFAEAHPIHLHGHDFWVLAQGSGTFNSSTTTPTLLNGPRRDVAMLPGSGYLVIAYYTDNPGVSSPIHYHFHPFLPLSHRKRISSYLPFSKQAWLLHCHIAWHASGGFALQLLERESEMTALMNVTAINSTCANWDAYVTEDSIVQGDSGV